MDVAFVSGDATNRRWSPIWRCEHCGGLVHPSNAVPVTWCLRCQRVVRAVSDGHQKADPQ